MPRLLRAAGLRLITLAEHYGVPADEGVSDEEWLEFAGSRALTVFAKDKRVRYTPIEKETIRLHGVRYFYLSGQNLTAVTMANRFLGQIAAMAAACSEPGPFIYAVHAKRIERVHLD